MQDGQRGDDGGGQVTDVEDVAGDEVLNRHVSRRRPCEHSVRLPHRLGEGSYVESVDLPPVEHTGQTFDVVGVQVAEHDHGDVVNPQMVKA